MHVGNVSAWLRPGATLETGGLAPEGDPLLDSGLLTEVLETILNARAPFTRKLYTLKWHLFASWCEQSRFESVHCLVGPALELHQEQPSVGQAPVIKRVCVSQCCRACAN